MRMLFLLLSPHRPSGSLPFAPGGRSLPHMSPNLKNNTHLPFSLPACSTSYHRPLILQGMSVWPPRGPQIPCWPCVCLRTVVCWWSFCASVFQPADVRGCWFGRSWPCSWLSHGEREQHNWGVGKSKLAGILLLAALHAAIRALNYFGARRTNKTNTYSLNY